MTENREDESARVHGARARFAGEKPRKKLETAPCFRRERRSERKGGMGRLGNHTDAREVRFYLVLRDETRLSDGCTDVLLTRRRWEGGRGGLNV